LFNKLIHQIKFVQKTYSSHYQIIIPLFHLVFFCFYLHIRIYILRYFRIIRCTGGKMSSAQKKRERKGEVRELLRTNSEQKHPRPWRWCKGDLRDAQGKVVFSDNFIPFTPPRPRDSDPPTRRVIF